jgi:ammonium transporter, Amt family
MEKISDESLRLDRLEQLILELSNKLLQTTTSNRGLETTEISAGDSAWMLTATALVFFMTMPGLAIYYAGMIRAKNVLACAMQIFTITCLITFMWQLLGYTISFSPINDNTNGTAYALYGGLERFWFRGMTHETTHQMAPTIPESIFCAYQLTFAIITASLIFGSFADRRKYAPMIVAIWHLLVYCPIAHSNWHPTGWLNKLGALDYAGGNVVHISSGVSGLVTVLVIGNRKGFGVDKFEPDNVLLTFMGMSMLWVGWAGFNGGAAYNAGKQACYSVLNTLIATSSSALMWMFFEWGYRKQPSILGMISGAIAGLVCITPAAGYVSTTGAFLIGLTGGPLCFIGAQLKHWVGFDDALDGFGVHAIGGIIGGISVGFFADPAITGGPAGVYYGSFTVGGYQLAVQIVGVLFSIGWSSVGTLILLTIDSTVGLRISEEDEIEGDKRI